MTEKVRTLVSNRIAVKINSSAGIGAVYEESWNESLEHSSEHFSEDVNAVGAMTKCHKCDGWGHIARDCPSKGLGKGAKGGGKGGAGAQAQGGNGAGKGGGKASKRRTEPIFYANTDP